MSGTRIAVVDERNHFIRWTDRAEIHAAHLPHRSVQIFVFDGAGRLVLQRRHRDKLTWPSAWDISCSGHVEEADYPGGPDDDLDAVYRAVAHRELGEELGIAAELELLGVFAPEPGVHYEHLHLFRGVSDGPWTPQAEEVEEVRAVTPADFDAMVADPAVRVTTGLIYFVGWLRERGLW